MATACLGSMDSNPGAHGGDVFSLEVVGAWVSYGLAAAFFYNLHRFLFLWQKNKKNEALAHWLPLISGLLFGPIIYLIAMIGLKFGLNTDNWIWLIFILSSSVGFEIVRFGIKLK